MLPTSSQLTLESADYGVAAGFQICNAAHHVGAILTSMVPALHAPPCSRRRASQSQHCRHKGERGGGGGDICSTFMSGGRILFKLSVAYPLKPVLVAGS
eukprot:3624645-Rhodomonas_salina.4